MILHQNLDRSIDTVSGSATNSPSQDEKVEPGQISSSNCTAQSSFASLLHWCSFSLFFKSDKIVDSRIPPGDPALPDGCCCGWWCCWWLGRESQSRRLTLSVHIIYFLRFFILLGGFQSTNSPRDESQGFAVGVFRRYRRYNDNVKLVGMQSWPTRPPVLVRREHRWLDDLRNLLWEFGFGDEKACLGGFCFNLSFEES